MRIVGNYQYSLVFIQQDLLEVIHHQFAVHAVQLASRFVREYNQRAVDKCTRDGHPLLFTCPRARFALW